jgi:tetratricopeptide (TPR) repeat protein
MRLAILLVFAAAPALAQQPCTESMLNPGAQAPPQAYLMASFCHQQAGHLQEAVTVLRRGLKIRPATPVLERALGEILFRLEPEASEAGTLLEHAARLLPRDPEARHYYAQWAFLNSRQRICAAQERAALALPGLVDLALLQMNTLLGMCESALENPDAARAAFERAAAINAKQSIYDPIAAMQYVQFLIRYNDDARATQVVENILQRLPDFGPAHLQKARNLERAGNPAEAISEARTALSAAGNDINSERAAHTLLAKCLTALGKTEEAAREQQWINDHPNPETPRR